MGMMNTSYQRTGWICPKCGKVNSPDITSCNCPINIDNVDWNSVPSNPWTPPNEYIGQCPKCGIQLSRVMGYVCAQIGCPTGLGSTTRAGTTTSFGTVFLNE